MTKVNKMFFHAIVHGLVIYSVKNLEIQKKNSKPNGKCNTERQMDCVTWCKSSCMHTVTRDWQAKTLKYHSWGKPWITSSGKYLILFSTASQRAAFFLSKLKLEKEKLKKKVLRFEETNKGLSEVRVNNAMVHSGEQYINSMSKFGFS